METATWVLVSLCVLQVQTLYYSADHKLLDGGLLEGQAEVFGAEDDRVQFVQVHQTSTETGLVLPFSIADAVNCDIFRLRGLERADLFIYFLLLIFFFFFSARMHK